MTNEELERVEQRFRRRYRRKKLVNLLISAVIAVLGVSSFLYIWKFDGDGVLTFRWMTVDGTVFTTLISLFCLAVNAFEMFRYTELIFALSLLFSALLYRGNRRRDTKTSCASAPTRCCSLNSASATTRRSLSNIRSGR